jgi:hypothetical protein
MKRLCHHFIVSTVQYRQLKMAGLKSKQKIIKGIQQTFLIGNWHEGPQTLLLDIFVCLYVFISFTVLSFLSFPYMQLKNHFQKLYNFLQQLTKTLRYFIKLSKEALPPFHCDDSAILTIKDGRFEK